MQKKLVQSSLAMAAAAALGLGGAFVAGPAAADQPEVKVSSENAVQTAVYKNLSDSSGKLVSEVGRFGVDGDDLVVGVAKKTDKVKSFASKYDNVEIVVDPKYVAGEPQAKTDLVGGAGYLVSHPQGTAACSTGFAGWDDQGNQVVLTAGHCAVDTAGGVQNEILDMELPSSAEAVGGEGFVKAGVGSIGAWGFNQYGSEIIDNGDGTGTVADEDKAIDFAVIKVDDKFTTKAEVTDWTTAKAENDLSASTTKVTKVGAAVPGQSIQKSGRTTGVTTGTVLDDPEAFEYANIGGRAVHGFEVTSGGKRFSDHGDSGGAVYQGDTAVGVISGGPETGAWTWVADLENSLTKSDESFTLDDPNEEPEAPAAPTVEDQTIEPKGAITGKAAAGADVKVTWTGAAEGEATAKADDSGNFTLEGPEAEGDYEAKAVATVDGHSSEAASFTVTVKASDDSDAGAAADGDDSNAEADADSTDADASAGADGKDADADADGKDADASTAADGDDADASAAADGKDDEADSDADGDEKPEAPKVGDQTVVEGGKITGKAAPNAEVTLTWKPAGANAGSAQAQAAPAEGSVTVKTDADGNFSTEAPAEAGDYNYTAVVSVNGQNSEAAQFVVTVEAEEAPAERTLTVEPKEIAASDFVKEDKGVEITAEGFDEGEKVSLEVVAGPENVEGITLEETANADGVVGFSIYGTSASNPEAYLGKYDVEVTGANDTEEEEALTGSFQVVADEDGNGGGDDGDDNGNDDGNGDGGSDLPRTGAELTGLAAGAGLLLVGGAAVVLTMRRKKNN
ncbi:trypsin-like serine protease [Brevibacterium linens]|uniref:LPXTG-motif cell wall anchor domain-containing protein n=1 Tax=Brevibacterium linens ATCC 9172 TaxID=1255617 RepID=A0A2H1I3G0_BRELN|nr:trypsin-like serine protease [Brevibacterium linens]KAB1949074.1 trypsin-like serine protease [Brevibacterium linens ATCC 9172]SMX69727.1 LPXTG-motif cell wall anchor domain-containing protein [Brevibacterium linens ATCC 9172]